MSHWSKNLAVLRSRFPETARRLEAVRGRRSAAAARPVAESERLAARWLRGRRVRNGAWLAVSGFGDGVHVRAVLGVLPPRARVFVAEAQPADLRAACEASDLTELLADPRLDVACGETDDAFFAAVNSPAVLHATDVDAWLFAPAYNRAPAYHARFFTEFARQVDVWRRLHGTWVKDAEMWQANTLANLPSLADAPDVATLLGALRGLPIVLVSAGPSLDESLEFLRAASRVAVIVAVNSSYRAVRHAGIVPPLVLAADPRGFTARGFQQVPVEGTWLVTTHIVHPDVVRLFAPRVFTWTNGYSLVNNLRRRCGLAPGTTIVEQGTVSACAVDLAVVLGSARICLVGQDLAVRDDGRSHAEDSFYTDTNTNFAETTVCRRLPGNTLPTVPVEEKLFVYLKTFEQLVAHRPQLKFINTARLGARIAGVPYVGFDEALRWLGQGRADRVPALLESRHAAGRRHALQLPRAVAALRATAEYSREVLGRALRAAAVIDRLPQELLQTDAAREAAEVRAACAALDDLRRCLESRPAEREILEAGRTRFELFAAQRAEARWGDGPELWREILRERESAWAVAEGAWFLTEALRRFDAAVSTREKA